MSYDKMESLGNKGVCLLVNLCSHSDVLLYMSIDKRYLWKPNQWLCRWMKPESYTIQGAAQQGAGIREHLKPPQAASALSSFSSICTQASGIALAGIRTNGWDHRTGFIAALGLGWGVFGFPPAVCHSVLDLALQETGAAFLDFVRSCISFIAKLGFGTQASFISFCVDE